MGINSQIFISDDEVEFKYIDVVSRKKIQNLLISTNRNNIFWNFYNKLALKKGIFF